MTAAAETCAPYVLTWVFPPAFALLPGVMDTPEARALVLTIGLQESGFIHRRQLAGGPARGFYGFEQRGGISGVLTHSASKLPIAHVCAELCYPVDAAACYAAVEHNDVLATCFARLLLWTLPDRLPDRFQPDQAWRCYDAAWRPGKPHPETWNRHHAAAWELVTAWT